MHMATQGGMPLHTKMLIGFVVGIMAGLAANWFAADPDWLSGWPTYAVNSLVAVAYPIGQIFLRLLFMLVIPLVFSALVLGVVEIGDPRSLGRIGIKTLAFVLVITTVAALIGLVVVNIMQPGQGLSPEVGQAMLSGAADRAGEIAAKREGIDGINLLLNIVPKNPIASAANGDLIGVMFFALMFGIAAAIVRSEGVTSFLGAVQGVYDISLALIGWVIKLAPYAVAALLFEVTAKLGLDVLAKLAWYVVTVVLALAIHFFVVFPLLVRFIGGMSPLLFFKRCEPAILTAFSTSSSSATLPTTLKVAEESLGVPRRVGRFVCTLGATANMNGTALFEGVTVLFLAQFFGIELGLGQQLAVLVMCMLGAIGAAGVPGGSLPVIAMILAMFGIPPEGIGIILGVDRFLDMCRTTVNVTGDLVGAVVVSRGEPVGEHAAPV